MITANQYNLSWEQFEVVNKDKRRAFENMCRSLFWRTLVFEEDYLHSNPNHPGVEVAPVRSKNGKDKISFQAKYFDGHPRYEDIKESIETAIKYNKDNLNKIYLYCNKDINTNTKTYKELYSIAVAAGIEIKLITGQSILDEASKINSILACYFGLNRIDQDWYKSNLQISLDNLGKRYNAEFNIDTLARHELSIFLKDEIGISEINNKKQLAIQELKDLKLKTDSDCTGLIKQLMDVISNIPNVSKRTVSESIKWQEKVIQSAAYSMLNIFENTLQEKLTEINPESSDYIALKHKLFALNSIFSVIEDFGLSEHETRLINNKVLLISGEMGTGKSQLLAVSAKQMVDRNKAALLLLGQTYTSEETIDIQIIHGLVGIDKNTSLESLLAVMDEQAYLDNEYAVVFIDAINETRHKDVWKTGINRLIATVNSYNNILLVISLRKGFEPLLLSEKTIADKTNGSIALIVHAGLLSDTPQSVFDFLTHYGIPVSPEYYLQHEMFNPLFLTWFCQTYSGNKLDFYSLIALVINSVDVEASKAAGHSETLGLMEPLLTEYIVTSDANIVDKTTILGLKAWELYGVKDKIAYLKAAERAGLLVEYYQDGKEFYYIGYNLLEEYIWAKWIVDNNVSKDAIIDYCINNLMSVKSDGTVSSKGNESIIAMALALYSEKYSEECLEILDRISDDSDTERLIEKILLTYTWRESKIILYDLFLIIRKHEVEPKTVWNVFLECATQEHSVFNANGLGEILREYTLNRRDCLWTIYINELTEYDRVINLAYYVEAGNCLDEMPDDKVLLLLKLYSWMLSSTNRVIRDRISKAMIELLKCRLGMCEILLEEFNSVNDPYILQRLYGIVFGAIMRRQKAFENEFESLAHKVYSLIFLKDKVYPDILLRDYARLIIERFAVEYPSKTNFADFTRVKPPYKSDPIPRVDTVDYSEKKYHEGGIWQLVSSMKFDLDVKGIGLYGDFGRYIFQSALRNFKGIDEKNIYYFSLKYIFNDLGYSNGLFSDYDYSRASYGRHMWQKVERIGKKYQWITMYNVLARLSDTNKIDVWNNEDGRDFLGAWELGVRNFDPTINIRCHVNKDLFPYFIETEIDENRFIDITSNEDEAKSWTAANDDMFSSFPKRFIRTDSNGIKWVSIYLSQEINKKVNTEDDYVLGIPRGEQRIWAISSMHEINGKHSISLSDLNSSGYINYREGMNHYREFRDLFIQEYTWGSGFKAESCDYECEDDECPLDAKPVAINAIWESQYDASIGEAVSAYMPSDDIIQELNLYQKDLLGVFYCNNEIVAFDNAVLGAPNRELLIRKDKLDEYLNKRHVQLFWCIDGEKMFSLGEYNQSYQRREGYFLLGKDSVVGEIKVEAN